MCRPESVRSRRRNSIYKLWSLFFINPNNAHLLRLTCAPGLIASDLTMIDRDLLFAEPFF